MLAAPANCIVGPPPSDLPVEAMELTSESGAKIAAWYIPAEHSVATVILLHPIRGNRLTMLDRARLIWKAGYSVLAIDMQAHGESTAKFITFGYLERLDVRAAVGFARTKNPQHKIAVLGRSLGGAAVLLGSPLGIDALVLESVYPTIDDAVADRLRIRLGPLAPLFLPFLTWQLKARLGIDAKELRPIDHIAVVGCPVLVMAGGGDEQTTMAESRRLFAAATERKEMVFFEGVGHADLLSASPDLYRESVLGFFAKCLESNATPRAESTP
jgi:uncharacterized protein